MADTKIVVKNNKFRMKNKQVSNKAKGTAWGVLAGIAVQLGMKALGVEIPEELATEIGAAVVGGFSLLGAWLSGADDPDTIEAVPAREAE